jgi:hypothetical protein
MYSCIAGADSTVLNSVLNSPDRYWNYSESINTPKVSCAIWGTGAVTFIFVMQYCSPRSFVLCPPFW